MTFGTIIFSLIGGGYDSDDDADVYTLSVECVPATLLPANASRRAIPVTILFKTSANVMLNSSGKSRDGRGSGGGGRSHRYLMNYSIAFLR